MTIKQLIIAIKHGANIRFVMQKYGYENEEELFQAIRKMAPAGADDLIRQIKRNDKKASKVVATEVDVEADTEVETEVEAEVDTEVEAEVDTETESSLSELEQLQESEREISNLLCQLEGRHKENVCERRKLADSIRETKNGIKKLLDQVARKEKEFLMECELHQELGEKMHALDTQMEEYRMILGDIRERIEELKQVCILVSSDGIEVENAEVPVTQDKNVKDLFDTLMHHEAAEELMVREIKTVTKLLLMVGAFEKYEVMFDNSRMETFFEQVKSFAP